MISGIENNIKKYHTFTKIFTMACTKYSLDQYNTLTAAISTGATKVQYGDKVVEYRNLDDMLRIQIEMERCLFTSKTGSNGKTYASFSKGTFRYNRKRC